MPRKPNQDERPKVNAQLSGFDIRINEFGEIISSYDVQKLNEFLDERVDDKKFRGVDIKRREEDEPVSE